MMEMNEKLRSEIKTAFLEALQEARETDPNAVGLMEVALFSGSISEEFGIPRPDVLVKSLALFKLAAEAEREGNKIAILNGDDEIITELSGIRERYIGTLAEVAGSATVSFAGVQTQDAAVQIGR